MISEKSLFKFFPSMGALYGHGGHLDLRTVTMYTKFQSPFNTVLHMKLEEIWPRGFRGEVVQRCERIDRQTDGRTNGQTTDADGG